jgi:plasmid stability protein
MTLRDVAHRTTLTLDDDVAAKLDVEARRTGRPYRVVVNEALRRGLEQPVQAPAPYTVAARAMGVRPGIELDDVEGLLDLLDGPSRR